MNGCRLNEYLHSLFKLVFKAISKLTEISMKATIEQKNLSRGLHNVSRCSDSSMKTLMTMIGNPTNAS